jgi:hypothetical protein
MSDYPTYVELPRCDARKDPRIISRSQKSDVKWYSFQLNSADDLRDALWWLSRACKAAK